MRTFGHGLLLLGAALSQVAGVAALSGAEWRKQSVYQVVTDRFARTDGSTTAKCDPKEQVYCGGTYKGLIDKLDYIQGMGFTAVWISPVVKNIDGLAADGSGYHGYWAQDIWSLNEAFGTEADLVALSAALHARGMYFMLDIVTNHMAYMGCRDCVDYSTLNPFNSKSQYHTPCEINYNSQDSIEKCWEGSNVVSLVDLRTEDDGVRKIWNDWIAKMNAKYSIDGLRVDSAKHVEGSFWPGFQAAAGGMYMVGEVFQGDPNYVAPYQRYFDGMTDYPNYYFILRAFQSSSGSMSELATGLDNIRGIATDPSLYGSFLENHDVERFPHFTQDKALAKNAIAITMLKDGIPLVYQGQEQHYDGGETPLNREALWFSGYSTTSDFYQWIASLNKIRSWAIAQNADYVTYKAYPIYSDNNNIAMRKGTAGYQVVGVYTNSGSSSSNTVTLGSSATGFTANQALIDVMSCTALTADGSGGVTVTLKNGLSSVLYPKDRLTGSGICPDLTGGTPSPTPGTTVGTITSATPGTSASVDPVTSTSVDSVTSACSASGTATSIPASTLESTPASTLESTAVVSTAKSTAESTTASTPASTAASASTSGEIVTSACSANGTTTSTPESTSESISESTSKSTASSTPASASPSGEIVTSACSANGTTTSTPESASESTTSSTAASASTSGEIVTSACSANGTTTSIPESTSESVSKSTSKSITESTTTNTQASTVTSTSTSAATSSATSTDTDTDDDGCETDTPESTTASTPASTTDTPASTTDTPASMSAGADTDTSACPAPTLRRVVKRDGSGAVCSLAAADITFKQLVPVTNTVLGDTIKIVGNIAALGKWDPRKALALDRTPYRQSNPLWGVTVQLAPGTTVQYKFIKVSSSGKVTWEADPSRTYTVPCKAETVDLEWERR